MWFFVSPFSLWNWPTSSGSPAALALPGSLCYMQTLRPHPDLQDPGLRFNKISRGSGCTLFWAAQLRPWLSDTELTGYTVLQYSLSARPVAWKEGAAGVNTLPHRLACPPSSVPHCWLGIRLASPHRRVASPTACSWPLTSLHRPAARLTGCKWLLHCSVSKLLCRFSTVTTFACE